MDREVVGEFNSTTTVSGNRCSSPEVDVKLSPEVENRTQPDPPPSARHSVRGFSQSGLGLPYIQIK